MLQDRLIALTRPQALREVKAEEDPVDGGVKYVDEEPGTGLVREAARVRYDEE